MRLKFAVVEDIPVSHGRKRYRKAIIYKWRAKANISKIQCQFLRAPVPRAIQGSVYGLPDGFVSTANGSELVSKQTGSLPFAVLTRTFIPHSL